MNDFETEFIAKHKLNPDYFFDAGGNQLFQELKNQMKANDKLFAFNTAPCTNGGHTLKSRQGHCIVCDTSDIAFYLRHYQEGFVYIAGSLSKKRIKIGATNNIEKREKYLNENKGYGNVNDWQILYYVKTLKMPHHEFALQNLLSKYNEPPINYMLGKELKTATEIYRCCYKKAYDTFLEYFSDNLKISKMLVSDFEKFKFPNLPR